MQVMKNKEQLYILPSGNAIKLSNIESVQVHFGEKIMDIVVLPYVVIGLINNKYVTISFDTFDKALETRNTIIKDFNDLISNDTKQ